MRSREAAAGALKTVGTTLVMKVGAPPARFNGTLFMTLGKELPEAPSRNDVARAFAWPSMR